mmetsp:Transcript_7163/g.10457  ORF Transcript_7163/g.10457 Transcript_7163/m.10457 type:complete len:207 (+) Transcript_7163:79-699(+)
MGKLLYFVATVLFLAGNALNGAASFYCFFVETTFTTGDPDKFENYGIWMIENVTDNTCYLPGLEGGLTFSSFDEVWGDLKGWYNYNSSFWYKDQFLVLARAAGTGALFLGFCCWALMLCGMCSSWTKGHCFRGCMGAIAFISAILAGGQFVVLHSEALCDSNAEDVCHLGLAGTLNIGCVCSYAAAGLACCLLPDEAEPEDEKLPR